MIDKEHKGNLSLGKGLTNPSESVIIYLMMDSDKILQRAIRRRENLRKELDEIDSFIRTFKRLEAVEDVTGVDSLQLRVRERARVDKKTVQSSPQHEVESAVYEILDKSTEPISTKYMLELIAERGVVIGGQNPRWNLSAKISRMPKVISIQGHGWWIMDRPCAAVKYYPPQETEGPDEDQSSSPSDESGTLPLNS